MATKVFISYCASSATSSNSIRRSIITRCAYSAAWDSWRRADKRFTIRTAAGCQLVQLDRPQYLESAEIVTPVFDKPRSGVAPFVVRRLRAVRNLRAILEPRVRSPGRSRRDGTQKLRYQRGNGSNFLTRPARFPPTQAHSKPSASRHAAGSCSSRLFFPEMRAPRRGSARCGFIIPGFPISIVICPRCIARMPDRPHFWIGFSPTSAPTPRSKTRSPQCSFSSTFAARPPETSRSWPPGLASPSTLPGTKCGSSW